MLVAVLLGLVGELTENAVSPKLVRVLPARWRRNLRKLGGQVKIVSGWVEAKMYVDGRSSDGAGTKYKSTL